MKTMYDAYQEAQRETVAHYMDKYNALLRNLDGITRASTTVKGAEAAVKWIDRQSGRLEKMLEKMPDSLGNVRSLIKGEIGKQQKRQQKILESNSISAPSKKELVEAVVNEYDGNNYVILPIKTADAKQENQTMSFIYRHCFETLKELGIRPQIMSFNGYLTFRTRRNIGLDQALLMGVQTQYIDFKVSTGYSFEMPKQKSKSKKVAKPADPKDPTKQHLRDLFKKGWKVKNVMEMYPELPEWHLRGIKSGVTKQMQNGKGK